MNDGIFMVIIAVSFTMVVGVHLGIKIEQNSAVQHQCAEYNLTTGNFQWLYEKKK